MFDFTTEKTEEKSLDYRVDFWQQANGLKLAISILSPDVSIVLFYKIFEIGGNVHVRMIDEEIRSGILANNCEQR